MVRRTRRSFVCWLVAMCSMQASCASLAGTIGGTDGNVVSDALHVRQPMQIAQAQELTACLTVSNGADTPGAQLVLGPCAARAESTFTLQGGRLHVFSTSCVTQVPQSGTEAASLVIEPCDVASAQQRFDLDAGSNIVATDGTCVATLQDSTVDGVAATTTDCATRHTSQTWALLPLSASASTSSDAAPGPASGVTTPAAPTQGAPAPTTPTATTSADTQCPALGAWDATAAAFEAQVLVLVNAQRAQGAACPGGSTFAPATALTRDARLVCETRAYAKAMQVGGFFSHTGQDGTSPFDRMTAAGVVWTAASENIAEGQTSPAAVVQAWMSDAGHCEDLMGDYTMTGIGYYQGVWVQDFAKE